LLYWFLKWTVVRPWARLLCRARIEGIENLPVEGPVLLAANHLDAGDTVLLPGMLARRLVFPAKAELFEGRSLQGRLLTWFLRHVGMVPMDRSGGQASATGMDSIGRVLTQGRLLGLFPEGTRSPDGRLYKGKTGVARLALAYGVPVVPVGMINTELRPGPFGIPWYRSPVIRIGRPLDFDAYLGAGSNRDVLRWVTDEVMNAIAELTGQTYVDMYGVGAKQALARGETLVERVLPRPGYGREAPAGPSAHPDQARGAA
jgi:1-acyl-sn-glycerol-3-phosphate acyltransferase